VSILELAQIVATTLRPETQIRVAQKAVPGALPARYVPSVDRARELLALEEWTPLEEQIRRTADWYSDRDQRSGTQELG
jgi:nucleoside-diphosphate-sugar epimerase